MDASNIGPDGKVASLVEESAFDRLIILCNPVAQNTDQFSLAPETLLLVAATRRYRQPGIVDSEKCGFRE